MLAHVGRILAEKMAFQENFKNIDFSLVFQAFLSPRPAQHPTKCAQKLAGQLPESTSEDGLTYQGYLGPSWPRFWEFLGSMLRLLGSILAPTWRPRTIQSSPRAPKRPPRVPKSRPRAPKSCPRQPKSPPRANQDAQEPPRTSQIRA